MDTLSAAHHLKRFIKATGSLWLDDLDPALDILRCIDPHANPHLLQTAIEHLMMEKKLVPRVHLNSEGHNYCVFVLSGL